MPSAEPIPVTPPLAAVPPVVCAHCGAPVAAEHVESGASEQYCCPGCRIVAGMLREHALQGYYEQPRGSAAAPQPALATGRDYAEFDDPAFRALYTRALPAEGGEQRCAELLLE